MRIIGLKINGGGAGTLRNLKSTMWYPFGNYNQPTAENGWKWRREGTQEKDDRFLSTFYQSVTDERLSVDLSVSCIVGKNGSGKSTLLEVLLRILNNFAYRVLDEYADKNSEAPKTTKVRNLQNAPGLSAALYFETDGVLGVIDYQELKNNENTDPKIYYSYLSDTAERRLVKYEILPSAPKNKEIKNLFFGMFYTIFSNYSTYSSFGQLGKKLPWDDHTPNNDWMRGLLHKNDGYLTPITIVPYRDEDGIVDNKKEEKLASERLATLAILFHSQKKTFLGKYVPKRINYAFIDGAKEEYENDLEKLLDQQDLDVYRKEYLKAELRNSWNRVVVGNNIHANYQKDNEVVEIAMAYLMYKTIKISLIYSDYHAIWDSKHTDGQLSMALDNLVDMLFSEEDKESHVTQKIFRCLHFLKCGMYLREHEVIVNGKRELRKWGILPVSRFLEDNLKFDSDLSHSDLPLEKYDRYYDVLRLLPPPFIEWEVFYDEKQTGNKADELNGGYTIQQMSSGQKHLIYSASYIVYHIHNIQSVKEKDDKHVPYRHINLVLDEVELYYHPEFQRELLKTIIDMLAWSHVDGRRLRSIHILLVTHSPFVLSDVTNYHTLYMEDGRVSEDKERKNQQTLAANIHDLLLSPFFMDDTMGEVAQTAIMEIVSVHGISDMTDVQNAKAIARIPYYRYITKLIGEPYLQNTLGEMVDELEERLLSKENYLKKLQADRDSLDVRIREIEGEILE